MKKLQKLTLKQLENEMTVIGSDEQREMFGGYDNDCFWQCVAYMRNDTDVDALVLDYYVNTLGYTEAEADAYLSSNGASVQLVDIPNYYAYLGCDYDPDFSDGKYIVIFNNDDVEAYVSDGGSHAVVITGSNADGTLNYYDPQSGGAGVFSSADANNLTYAGY